MCGCRQSRASGTGDWHRAQNILDCSTGSTATCGVSRWNFLGLSFVSKALSVEKLPHSLDSMLQKSGFQINSAELYRLEPPGSELLLTLAG